MKLMGKPEIVGCECADWSECGAWRGWRVDGAGPGRAQQPSAQEKNGAAGKAKEGTKQAVEARLKAVEKPKAESAIHEVEKTLFATHQFGQAVISPDGKRVAWVEMLIGKDGAPSGKTAIYVSEIETKVAAKRLSVGAGGGAAAGAKAGGKDLRRGECGVVAGQQEDCVFVGRGEGWAAAALCDECVGRRGEEVDQREGLPGGAELVAGWEDDCGAVYGECHAGVGAAGGGDSRDGEIKDAFFEQRLAVVDVASGKLRQISPADTYIYEYDWSPDGLRFAVTAALGNGDNNWWIAELYTLEGAGGLMKSIYKPHLQIANPVWSPDGERVAFIEGLMSDEGLTGGDIFTVPAAGGNAENVTPDVKGTASWIRWTPEGKLMVGAIVGGDAGIATVHPDSQEIEVLWRGGEYLMADPGVYCPTISLAKDGKTMAFVRQSYAAPPEVWAGPVGAWKQITRRNEG